ncbi:MAG: tRNA-2-methylthio-N6-dimethylallyladenosine synthase [Maribacter sp.]|jgi:tRNA-2-methylthio-N6-dimethylallyladenosine synthase
MDNNTTNTLMDKSINEEQQGDVFFQEQLATKAVNKHFYIESYGCQMNFSDSEIVASILGEMGYASTKDMYESDLILINTCSIREKAEDTVRKRLRVFDKVKKKKPGTLVGVLGCMAERLKGKFLEQEKLVDIVVGPDSYRSLPQLVSDASIGEKGVNVLLSREETYADISPVRLNSNGVTAFISIMRGCNNMCSFCIVPFTRGRERSREPFSIIAEATELFNNGYREITLLGQNVDSFLWKNPETEETVNFAQLLEMTAKVNPDLRVRFSTSHPKDITDEVIHTMAAYENICNYIHLPVQSGNSRILKLMNRTYDRAWYKERVESIYRIIPNCAISSDMISGFCSETEEEHQDTLTMMEFAQYSTSYMFFYSERPGTLAAKKYEDDITLEVKKRRLAEIIRLQNQISFKKNQSDIGETYKVLVEGTSRKSENDFKSRNSHNKVIIFPKVEGLELGMYCHVKVIEVTSATLKGIVVSEQLAASS